MFDLIKRFAISFAGSFLGAGILSWLFAGYLINAFQQAVDTNSASQNGRMDGLQQQLNLIQTQQDNVSDVIRSIDSNISETNRLQKEFTLVGLDRIDALAASTDFLISQADRLLSQVEPTSPVTMGKLRETYTPRLTTGKSGRFVGTFEADQPSMIFIDFPPSTSRNPLPALFTISLFKEDSSEVQQFTMSSQVAVIVNGVIQNNASLLVPVQGSYVIVITALPDVNFNVSSFPLTREQ